MKDFTPVDPNISMYILLFVPYTFPMTLTRRIMLKNQKLFKFAIISIILMSLMFDSVVTSWWEIDAKCPQGVKVLGVEVCDFWVNFPRTWIDSSSSKSSVPLVTCIWNNHLIYEYWYSTKTDFVLLQLFWHFVSALDSESDGSGSSPGWGHCVVFLGKTLYSHSASLHPGVQMGTNKYAGGNPVMD